MGFFLAGLWNWGDTIILMVSESTPTNLRSSASGDQSMFAAACYLFGYITSIIYTKLGGNLQYLDFLFLALAIPGVISCILIITFKVNETKGIDLDKVTGSEWDRIK